MKRIATIIVLAAMLIGGGGPLYADKPVSELTFDGFIRYVLANNLDLIIETYEVSVADAALTASRVFEDPELELVFPAFDRDELSGFPRNIAVEMEIPIELFGKRRNRIAQAKAEKYATEAQLDDFLRHLRADAAGTFVELLSKQMILERMQLTLEQLNQLTAVNQSLFEAGEIGEIDVLQTRLEARNFQAELLDMQAEFSELLTEAYYLMGGIPADSLVFRGEFPASPPMIRPRELKERAMTTRPDILAARREAEAASYALRLARAERLPDISLIAGYHNEGALRPAPGFSVTYAGLIIPLRFSGFNSGAVRESQFRVEQSNTVLEATLLNVETGWQSAWESYQLLNKKRAIFSESILADAERVRDAILYSYQRGEVSLLEVLDAQRTMNEVYLNYYETLAQYAHSVIRLSKASGLWLLEL